MTDEHNPPKYSVGRGKPPKHSQFKPGQSGNPGGRPKGRKRICMSVLEEINKEITIMENGETQKIACGDAIAKRLIAIAIAKGDPKTIKMILDLEQAAEDRIWQLENEPTSRIDMTEQEASHVRDNAYYERVAEKEAVHLSKKYGFKLNEEMLSSAKPKNKPNPNTPPK